MTNKEAVKTLLTVMYRDNKTMQITVDRFIEDDFLYAIGMAICALMKQEEEERSKQK